MSETNPIFIRAEYEYEDIPKTERPITFKDISALRDITTRLGKEMVVDYMEHEGNGTTPNLTDEEYQKIGMAYLPSVMEQAFKGRVESTRSDFIRVDVNHDEMNLSDMIEEREADEMER